MNFLGTKLRHFSDKGSFTPKPHFYVFFLHTSGARAPALAFRSTAKLSIVSYSRSAKVISHSAGVTNLQSGVLLGSALDFFRTTYRFREA